jgi:glucuronate isomerase
MRANGVAEKYITGNASDREKFEKWAETVPYTLKNPLYHWTHLELKKPFGIIKLLDGNSAGEIYDITKRMLGQPGFSAKGILKFWNVEVVCTTDDPADTLEHHKKEQNGEIQLLPTWRPDNTMAVDDPVFYNEYLDRLSEVAGMEIKGFTTLIEALRKRHDHFAENGCRISDHGIGGFFADDYTQSEIEGIFRKIRSGKQPAEEEIRKFKAAMLYELAVMDHEKGWVQQFHFGAMRNNNSKMFRRLGPDSGFDSMGDGGHAVALAKFLDRLESENKLTKTVLYNINPKDNDTIATMTGNFQDGSIPGKIQWGAAWWFSDQKQGMENQLNTLSNHGLLSRFIGMLTDSRSLLSFSRHEYFRRILCNLLGNDMEKGLIPYDFGMIGRMVEDICYYNAKKYFEL